MQEPEVLLTKEHIDHELYLALKAFFVQAFGEEAGLAYHSWFAYYADDAGFLYKVYKMIADGAPQELIDSEKDFSYELLRGKLFVKEHGQTFYFDQHQAHKAIELLVDVAQDYLPLGSVVDLRKEEFKDIIDPLSLDNCRILITQRLVALEDTLTYFDYGGVIYPIGILKDYESLYFSSHLIENVIHKGFSDDTDLAFIASVKAELLFSRSYCSFRLASKTLKEQALEEIRNKGG